MTPAYLRPADAAEWLGIAPRTLRDWTQRGTIAHYKPSRKVCLFAVADLERAMRRYRIAGIGEGC